MRGPPLIPASRLRIGRKLASAASYQEPSHENLASAIVEGKRRLDEATHFEEVRPDSSCLDAPPARPHGDRFTLPPERALPLHRELAHRLLESQHLWIGVEKGVLIVLDDSDDLLFRELAKGRSPDEFERDSLRSLLARLAAAGFIRGIQGYTDSTPSDPGRFLRIHLTDRCNLTCVHCYTDSSPYVPSDTELPASRWAALIREFAEAGGERILFTGGEALAHAGCLSLMELGHELGLHVTLFTNGILVPKNVDRIASAADEVQVSVDGPSPESNDPIRGSGSFETAIRAIDELAARGVAVRVSTVAMQQNWSAIKNEYVEFAERRKDKNVSFKINYGLMSHGRGEGNAGAMDVNETRPIVDDLMSKLHPGDEERILRRAQSCGYAEQIVVSPSGEIHPCHLLDGALAHIDDGPLETLLEKIRSAGRDYDVDHNVGCNTCDIRHLCGGTCRVDNGKVTGNRRVTFCSADEKLRKLVALTQLFDTSI